MTTPRRAKQESVTVRCTKRMGSITVGNKTGCITAQKLQPGECFQKRFGTQTYIRLSPSSLKFFGLDEYRIIGAAANGNLCEVSPQKLVRLVPHSALLKDVADNHKWEKTMGCREPGLIRPTKVTEAFVQERKLTVDDQYRFLEIPVSPRHKAGDRLRVVLEAIGDMVKRAEA